MGGDGGGGVEGELPAIIRIRAVSCEGWEGGPLVGRVGPEHL
jgi:hypothetical protein